MPRPHKETHTRDVVPRCSRQKTPVTGGGWVPGGDPSEIWTRAQHAAHTTAATATLRHGRVPPGTPHGNAIRRQVVRVARAWSAPAPAPPTLIIHHATATHRTDGLHGVFAAAASIPKN